MKNSIDTSTTMIQQTSFWDLLLKGTGIPRFRLGTQKKNRVNRGYLLVVKGRKIG